MITRRLISALLIALVVSGMFTLWLSRKVAKPHVVAAAQLQYVAAATPLEAGEVLKPTSLKMMAWGSAPLDGAFAKPEDVAGRIVLFPLAAGEPILERQLSAVGAGAGLAVKIPDGMRAISVKSTEVTGVSGFLSPGAHVDVMVTYRQTGSQEPVTTTVLQDVEILAAGQKIQPDPEGKANTVDVVTLLVTPQDAQRVVLASSMLTSSQGEVHFVLRNGKDREQVKSSAVELSQLGGGTGTPRPAHADILPHAAVAAKPAHTSSPSAGYQVEMISGGKQSIESFK